MVNKRARQEHKCKNKAHVAGVGLGTFGKLLDGVDESDNVVATVGCLSEQIIVEDNAHSKSQSCYLDFGLKSAGFARDAVDVQRYGVEIFPYDLQQLFPLLISSKQLFFSAQHLEGAFARVILIDVFEQLADERSRAVGFFLGPAKIVVLFKFRLHLFESTQKKEPSEVDVGHTLGMGSQSLGKEC